MADDLTIRVTLGADGADALEAALLRARATELGEIRRRDVRLTTGYGDATTREVMDDESLRAQARYDALTAVLEALQTARR